MDRQDFLLRLGNGYTSMSLVLKSLCVVGIFGVVGTLKVIGPARIAEFFWFRPRAKRKVITNGQQEPKRATPATGSILSLGEEPTYTGKITAVQAIERLKSSLEEIGQFVQEKYTLEAHVNHLKEMTDPETRNIQEEEIKRLQAKLEKQDQLLQEKIAALSSAKQAAMEQEKLIHELLATNQRQREEIKQMKTARHASADTEQISMLTPPISVAEVGELLKMLNSHTEQAASHITDSLIYREPSKELEDVLNELIDYVGPWLCNDLRSKSEESSMEPDHLITQIAVQTGLGHACNHIVNTGIPPYDGVTLSRTNSGMLDAGQVVADAQKIHPHTYATMSQCGAWEINRKYLTGIALKLITAVGGSLASGACGGLPPQCHEALDEIVKRSLTLHKAVSEDPALMMELVTCTVPCGANFDPSRMEDMEGSGNETQDTVICTMEMGLQRSKRNEIGSREVIMKTKVVLASTLEV